MAESQFDSLLAAADAQPFAGWDFSYLQGRMDEAHPPWHYLERVRAQMSAASALLDMGTGGGEVLASLVPLPPRTVATEAYAPNVPVARERLVPLGVDVVQVAGAPDNVAIGGDPGTGNLPFAGESFMLVIDRHESYFAHEVYRVLAPDGLFITQQVGGGHNLLLNRLFGAPDPPYTAWNLAFAVSQLRQAGFAIVVQQEAFPETVFRDIGALAYYLKAVPWQVPGFTIDTCKEQLATLHGRILAEGGLRVPGHYFYLEARKR